ncbi:hypothetical protein J6590_012242 [Homalodisca vitripennis]|nr:hypothetical protein J6590_012242 [Homalodisca vitripennis]
MGATPRPRRSARRSARLGRHGRWKHGSSRQGLGDGPGVTHITRRPRPSAAGSIKITWQKTRSRLQWLEGNGSSTGHHERSEPARRWFTLAAKR